MSIFAAIPVINCKAIQQTLVFYQQLFGFVVMQKRESDAGLQWVLLRHGDSTLMLKHAEPDSSSARDRHPGVSLYLYVSDIEQLHHYIRAKGSTVSNIVLMDYQMYEFKITDPENNVITVGQGITPSA